jgi:hypothetical protein
MLDKRLKEAQEHDRHDRPHDRHVGWLQNTNGLWEFEGCLYVPDIEELRSEILSQNHDSPLAGHAGQAKTQEMVTRNYWWPTIKNDVEQYVKGCTICQQIKPHTAATKTPLH